MSMKLVRVVLGGVLAVALSVPAQSAILSFTNVGSFQAAATGTLTTLGFEGITPAGASTQILGGLSLGGHTFVGTGNTGSGNFDDTYVISPTAGFGAMPSDFLWGGFALGATGTLVVTLAPDVTAAGGLVSNFQFAGSGTVPVTVRALGSLGSDVSVIVNTLANPDYVFAGFTSTGGESIVSITYSINIASTAPASAIFLDDFQSNAVPEPASLILVGAGLAGLAYRARLRRKTA